jgi:ABC-type transporter MlaC component
METADMTTQREIIVPVFNAAFAQMRQLATRFFIVMILVLGTAQAAPALAAPANSAEAFVQKNIEKGYDILNDTSLSDEQRQAQFRDFILSFTDLHRIGIFSLGQYANGASKADIESFIEAFTDYTVAVYESRLSKYRNESLKVTGSVERASDDVVVSAGIVDPIHPNEPIHVAFRVRPANDGHLIVTDVQVEGVWLALNERSDLTGFLQQHGGAISALAKSLHLQAQQVRTSRPGPSGDLISISH